MKGFITNIEESTLENTDYRRVLYTTKSLQLVLMSVAPGDEIGLETHELSQFIRIEKGQAEVTMGDHSETVYEDSAFIIPGGVAHNVVNTGGVPLKLYSIYAPPEHKDGTIQATKADETKEHFDGVTSLTQ